MRKLKKTNNACKNDKNDKIDIGHDTIVGNRIGANNDDVCKLKPESALERGEHLQMLRISSTRKAPAYVSQDNRTRTTLANWFPCTIIIKGSCQYQEKRVQTPVTQQRKRSKTKPCINYCKKIIYQKDTNARCLKIHTGVILHEISVLQRH